MADIKVYGTLKNATQSGKLAYAEQVFDTEQNKTQAEINRVVGSSGKSRFKVVCWNLGNFSLGQSGDPTITPANFNEMRAKWRDAICGIGADIFLACEYNTNFMDAQGGDDAVTARVALFGPEIYQVAEIGPAPADNAYVQTAIFANLPLSASRIVYFSQTYQASRYYQVTETTINGRVVKIISTHLDFIPPDGTEEQKDAVHQIRIAQINELISECDDVEYAIICGDFNINYIADIGDYDIFKDAGFGMANHGYLGNIFTAPAGDSAYMVLDNIVYKGFTSAKIGTLNDATLSDHMALFADLTMDI
jgi:endonuclease/exonuclease/phosphatase family metal-dependent hydrolase